MMGERFRSNFGIGHTPDETNTGFQAESQCRAGEIFGKSWIETIMPNFNSCQLVSVIGDGPTMLARAQQCCVPTKVFAWLCAPRWWLGRNQGPGLAVGIGPALLQRRCVAHGLRVFHYGLEGGLECFHFILGADSDARVG